MTAAVQHASTASLIGFKPHLQVETVAGEAAYLISGRRVTALHGSAVSILAPLLDGTRDLPELRSACAGLLAGEQVERLVARLDGAGLLRRHEQEGSQGRQAYWDLAGIDGPQAARSLDTRSVRALSVGRTDVGRLRSALRAAGLLLTDDATQAALTLVLCDDYLSPELASAAQALKDAGASWLPVQVSGPEIWAGPVFGPPGSGDGPCLDCLTDRLWRGRQAEAHVQRLLSRPGPAPRPDCSLPAALATGLHLAALEAAKWLAGHRDAHQSALWTLDTLTLETGHHPVKRRPQCAGCGDPGLVGRQVRQPVRLVSRPKRDTSGGGHRSASPREVMDRFGHLVDPLTGPVAEIRRDPRGPEALNCFHAGHNPVVGAAGLDALRAGLRHTSSGKGVTPLHAKVSALCEALERHSGFHQGDEPVERGSYRALDADAVHPDSVQLFHPRQFEGRAGWNAAHGAFHQVCDPFDEDAAIDWTPVWSLTEGRRRLLPTSLLYFNAPQPPGRAFCWANSNGAAAGATLEDAVLQGTLELVERDAVAQWWYNRTRQPGIGLRASTDPWTGELLTLHGDMGREVWALDLTSDLGIPVVAALSRRTGAAAEDIVLGFGAHPDPAVALRRSLTELNQLLPYVVESRTDGSGYGTTDPSALRWFRTATLASEPHLRPDRDAPVARRRTAPTRNVADDITAVQNLLTEQGLDLLVLDQTRPDIGLPVAKVVVPGLRPHWARYAPGRLYDVPVRLGRLSAPLSYDELNPVPLFL
ncbi:TOMM precursor leader peptide-binding protein [Streptomyces sp. NPDC050421]|uniref:TOMM precursor leader peptide-binding protein n=1 Tax=Streptomyces sp. NPDC050421 TaxID=3365613 RepID=UPI0037BB222E